MYLYACLIGSLLTAGTLAVAQKAAPAEPVYITFAAADAGTFYPHSVNDTLAVTGSYIDTRQKSHGFLRDPSGVTEIFDLPGATSTFPMVINLAGDIAGTYNGADGEGGFIRNSTGEQATFNPGGTSASVQITGMNDEGSVIGYYSPTNAYPPYHAFVRSPDGTVVNIQIPNTDSVVPESINDNGEITGYFYYQHDTQIAGFLRSANGVIATFVYGQVIVPLSINETGMITGWYGDATGYHGFIRNTRGVITAFEPAGRIMTQFIKVDAAGEVMGSYEPPAPYKAPSPRGFLRSPGRAFISTFNPPGSIVTTPIDMSPGGVVLGTFETASGVQQIFLLIH